MKSQSVKIAALYVLGTATLFGALGGGVISLASREGVASLDQLRKEQESALVQKFEGAETLEQLLASHGFEIKYAGVSDRRSGEETRDIVAVANVSEALAAGCATDRFSNTRVCEEYGKIPAIVEAQAAAAEARYGWARPAAFALFGISLLSFIGAGWMFYRQLRYQELHQQSAQA